MTTMKVPPSSCMKQTMLIQFGAPGRFSDWTNLSHFQIVRGFADYIILLVLMGVELLWCLDVTLSKDALTCFLKSS